MSVAIIHNHPIHYKHLLFCAMAEKGVDFEVLFTAGSSGVRIEVPLPTHQEYRYSIGYPGPYEKAEKLSAARFVWRELNRIRPRVVILGGYYDIATWTAWMWAGLHKAGRVLWAESNSFDHQRHWWKELPKQLFVTRCDFAHVYGRSNLEYIKQLGMPADRIYIKRAVADTALYLKDSLAQIKKPENVTLIYCGRFSPEKNLSTLLRAFAKVRQNSDKPPMLLKLVGYGPLEDSLRHLALDLGVAQLVEFAGKARQAELPQIYRAADVLVLPSTREPWGLVVNEGMLSGLPVVVSDRCGCAVDLVTSETGWSFSPYDESELVQILSRIASTPRAELEKMGSAARALSSEYSPENCAAVVVQTVAKLAQAGRHGGRASIRQPQE